MLLVPYLPPPTEQITQCTSPEYSCNNVGHTSSYLLLTSGPELLSLGDTESVQK